MARNSIVIVGATLFILGVFVFAYHLGVRQGKREELGLLTEQALAIAKERDEVRACRAKLSAQSERAPADIEPAPAPSCGVTAWKNAAGQVTGATMTPECMKLWKVRIYGASIYYEVPE